MHVLQNGAYIPCLPNQLTKSKAGVVGPVGTLAQGMLNKNP